MSHATNGAHAETDTDLPRNRSPSPPVPSKASLKAWWNQFKFMQRMKTGAAEPGQRTLIPGFGHELKDGSAHPVFGAPLQESLKYASVQISTANSNGELYVWGDIPVVVAKCGLYLKENATEVEGTFRVSGSTKRMRDLQALFETPPKYGKNLDWKKENYTSHDVASVFRRYLNQMPEPVIPHNLYAKFREPLAKKTSTDEVIKTYKQLIRSMPPQNQYLLLYVLDLLSVFARKSDRNLMTATNLAVIFRPGLINHPQHDLSPKEHALSQEVLEFLIEHQDWFMLDVPAPPPRPQKLSSQQQALPPIPDEGEQARSDSPHLTIISVNSPSEAGWRLVERPVESVTDSPTTPKRVSKGGRRRSSSASGEIAAVGTPGSHVRMASAEPPSSATVPGPGPVGTGVNAASVTRSRTLPSRVERSRKDKDISRESTTRNARDREREQRHREGGEAAVTATSPTGGSSASKEARNVLKKQKRASMQNQRTTSHPSGTIPHSGHVQRHNPATSEARAGTAQGGGSS